MKCGIDEFLELVQDFLEENISQESFDKTLQTLQTLQFLIDNEATLM